MDRGTPESHNVLGGSNTKSRAETQQFHRGWRLPGWAAIKDNILFLGPSAGGIALTARIPNGKAILGLKQIGTPDTSLWSAFSLWARQTFQHRVWYVDGKRRRLGRACCGENTLHGQQHPRPWPNNRRCQLGGWGGRRHSRQSKTPTLATTFHIDSVLRYGQKAHTKTAQDMACGFLQVS